MAPPIVNAQAPKATALRVLLLATIFGGIGWLLYSYIFASNLEVPVQIYPAQTVCDPRDYPGTRRIAVVGAGSGGASTAYYINKFRSPCQAVNITVYERSHYVGGRSTTVNVYSDPTEPVELGASIFVKVNKNLVSAAEELGLTIEDSGINRPKESPQMLGVWDGKQFVFVQDQGTNAWWDIAKLLWKYGLDPLRTQRLTAKTVGNFLKMYSPPYFPFHSLSEVAHELGLTHATATTGVGFLAQNQITGAFATDIIQASTRVNYAQNLGEIHGLEAIVCMSTDGAMAVKGGNWQIFASMLKDAHVHLVLNNSVGSIAKQLNGTYTVRSTPQHSSGAVAAAALQDNFDEVILAAPFQFSSLEITPPLARAPDTIPYVSLHVTLFTSPHKLSPHAFNLPSGSPVPEIVLTTLPSGSSSSANHSAPSRFFSISTLRSVSNSEHEPPRKEYLYKIFSPEQLTAAMLATLFDFPAPAGGEEGGMQDISKEDVSWVYEKVWHSYPYLHPRVTFEELKLDEGLWYTSGVESFISTMETSSLMGMNVARLVVDEWESGKVARNGGERGGEL